MPTPQQLEVIQRCRKSACWFLRNFGKIRHAKAGIIPFHPFRYQREAIKAFRTQRLNIFRKCRQSGISKISGAFATWLAMFHPHKTILIVSRRNDDAMGFLRDHIVFLYEHLPDWMVEMWKPIKQNEHEIMFPNGSHIKSLTSHPDVLRSHSSSLNIIDEAAFIQNMDTMWAGGWPCLVGETLVQTDEGLVTLASLNKNGKEWQDLDLRVATDDGYKICSKFHIPNDGATTNTIKLTTDHGFTIEGTPHHRVRTITASGRYTWKKLGCFVEGDTIVMRGGDYVGKRQFVNGMEITEDVARNIGLYIGSAGEQGDRYDFDVTESIPSCILKSDKAVVIEFVHALLTSCEIYVDGTQAAVFMDHKKSARELHTLLFALGVHGSLKDTEVTISAHAYQSICDIGFVADLDTSKIDNPVLVREFMDDMQREVDSTQSHEAKEKLKAGYDKWEQDQTVPYFVVEDMTYRYDLSNKLSDLIRKNLRFEKVTKKERGTARVYDLEVPTNNTYIANGIVSHNTLQHGGSVIVISTTSGVGGWYWSTCVDAEAGLNDFNPIVINWWDMDWEIEYYDDLTCQMQRISPTDGIRECKTQEEIEKFGPYWSPWLQSQYDNLQEQGEAWRFDQEVRALFVGSGNTVLSKEVLTHLQTTVEDPPSKIKGQQTYVHPMTGVAEALEFSFPGDEGLWVWKPPVVATPEKRRGNEIIEEAQPGHRYAMGVDIATGKGNDLSAIEVIDIDTLEQAAELMVRCLPSELIKYIDRIGRWYNLALAVIERNNGGDIVIDELRYNVAYPRLWRKKDINDRPSKTSTKRALQVAQYGFYTSVATKPVLNRLLIDCIRKDDGFKIYSKRLLKQLTTYVRKRDRAGRDTMRTEAEEGLGNYDDLVMAFALGLVGANDSFSFESGNLMPFNNQAANSLDISDVRAETRQQQLIESGGQFLVMPVTMQTELSPEESAQQALESYMLQLGGIPISDNKPIVLPKKYFE